jgi:hypothetical protein
MQTALKYLKEHNPHYADVEIDDTWQVGDDDVIHADNVIQADESGNMTHETEQNTNTMQDNDATESDDETEENHDPRDPFSAVPFDSLLQPQDLHTEALAEFENMVYSVAPGQGNKPISMFRPGDNDTQKQPRSQLSFPLARIHSKLKGK